LFSRAIKHYLFIGVVIIGVFAFSLFTSTSIFSSYQNEYVVNGKVGSTTRNKKALAEYIIVLEDNVSFAIATHRFKKYHVRIIRDLNKGRYLIGIRHDPGIKHLQKIIQDTGHIKHIQSNSPYTVQ